MILVSALGNLWGIGSLLPRVPLGASKYENEDLKCEYNDLTAGFKREWGIFIATSLAEERYSIITLFSKGIIMDQSNRSPLPNIHMPQNARLLAYLKEMHPFSEIIVPFSEKRVNQDTIPADLVGRFSAMSSLPANSKYVIYGREALVHPETGIIFGFITGTTVIYRLPDPLLKEVLESNLTNFRVMKDTGINMETLESNWVSSPSITEPLVRKCYEYYAQSSPEEELVHLNLDLDLTTPRTREFEKQERSRRLLPLGIIIVVCALGTLLWYAGTYLLKLF